MKPADRHFNGKVRPDQRPIFGLDISLLAQDELIEELLSPPSTGSAKLVATVNVDHVVTLRTNPRFRQAYAYAWRITADGTPVYLYARAVGVPLRQRVTGADLFAELVERWEPGRHSLFMLVPSDAVAARMTLAMEQRGFDRRNLAIEVPPFGFESDAAYNQDLVARIGAMKPTHIIMGVGAPKSEIWAHEHREQLGDAIILCVGAAVEFVTGLKMRSPIFMRRIGMEWFWRFATEPRRLFHRYFIRSFGFVLAMLADRRRDEALGPAHD
jgi:N-acetylglucosaminyldiphosphoundecaprenol N-acetyl-beta-D-mannosaminyltransferase